MQTKLFIASTAVTLLVTSSASAAILISGISDGTNTGGNPKALEIFATTAIPDLSIYYIARDTNGAGPWDTFVQLPTVALAEGDFFYVAGNSDSATTLDGFGFTVGLTNSILAVNGDDIVGLATSDTPASVFDSIGLVAQGDTNFYENSFAVRKNTSNAPEVSLADGSNFTITSYSDAAIQGATGFGSFAPVPEPSTALLGGIALLGLLRRRR